MKRASGAGRHDIGRVPAPLAGYPGDIPTSIHNTRRDLTPVAVVDVYDAERRVRALARIDLLDRERRSRKISEAAYQVGRSIERALQPVARSSGWMVGDRVDAATQVELAVMLGFERAQEVNGMLGWLLREVGRQDARLLWLVLGHGLLFTTAAAAFGRNSVRGQRYTVDRFRDALEVLAEAKAARGKGIVREPAGRGRVWDD